jgi:hypothetical protein
MQVLIGVWPQKIQITDYVQIISEIACPKAQDLCFLA